MINWLMQVLVKNQLKNVYIWSKFNLLIDTLHKRTKYNSIYNFQIFN